MEALLAAIPSYANDLKLNLSSVLNQPELTARQTWGTAVACALASRNPQLTRAIVAEAEPHLIPRAMDAAKAAAAIMGMNNIYFRFFDLSGDRETYAAIRSRLRMEVVRRHGVDRADFDLWCTAVSAINGCGDCVSAHERALTERGVGKEAIVAAIRIAAVIHGLAGVLDAESALR